MLKQSTKITLTYCGMAGTGPTVKEAKQDAARKIESVLSMHFQPVILRFKDMMGVCWNTPDGPVSALCAEDGHIGGTCHHGAGTALEDTVRSMRYNLAQLTADVESNEIPAILGTDKRLIADYTNWLGFQRAYRAAQGGDAAKHQFACEHAHEYAPVIVGELIAGGAR